MPQSTTNASRKWTIQEIITWTANHFTEKKIPSARLDAELLLAQILGCKRIDLYLRFDQPLKDQELTQMREKIKRRVAKEPMAYILGEQEFFGRKFLVGSGCLIPRPETEHIVESGVAWLKASAASEIKILDVATGSGCLGATMYLEALKAGKVPSLTAVDISPEALVHAKNNFILHQISERLTVVEQDFLKWVMDTASTDHKYFDLIVCNPPYISQTEELMPDVKNFEPALALFGGESGLEIINQWLPHLVSLLRPGGLLLCEIGHDQKAEIKNKFQEKFLSMEFLKDHSAKDRIIKIIKEN